jgi:putative IMPACT (imprinted ancient) family translation regulator
MKKNLEIDFGNMREIKTNFFLLDKIIKDRGSVYSACAGRVENREEIKNFVKKVRNHNKRFQKASHHSYAVRVSKDGVFYETKSDDGETGAGNIILRILQKQKYTNMVVCVTRWFGGTKLESDRFKHIQDSTILVLEEVKKV